MGNSKSKKTQKEPDKFFERERWKEQKREEKRKKQVLRSLANQRVGMLATPAPLLGPGPTAAPPGVAVAPPPANIRSYDDEALDRMRYQLNNDSNAFLLNNILLSVQFFENFEREVSHIKSNPVNEREHLIEQAMVCLNKHVFFADRLQECVHEHVGFERLKGAVEPLAAPRLFVIYDNVEASEPGDTSDYSAVLDAPFYKLRIEDCKEPGYSKLRKTEVLESTQTKEDGHYAMNSGLPSDDSMFTNSEKESLDSEDSNDDVSKGKELLQKLESKLIKSKINQENYIRSNNITVNQNVVKLSGRRQSGPTKQLSLQAAKSTIDNIKVFHKENIPLPEINNDSRKDQLEDSDFKPRKSILKTSRRPSGPIKEQKNKAQFGGMRKAISESMLADDTETSGYRSTGSSRHNESSETESDYGYSTITESTTPKKLELSLLSNHPVTSGVLPDECWTPVQVKAVDSWTDDEDEELDNAASKESLSRVLYETIYYLNSEHFMKNFVDNFILNLGPALSLSQEDINRAMTQGASIYCDTVKNGTKMGSEIFPALIAAWPNAANQWIIRERKIIQNPRTNHSYQWPTKYMVNKAIGFGCLLVPVGFRPKRGLNPDQTLQWRVTFPAAERYLESCLAHSHMRCYLFTLALHKAFIENDNYKVGIDAQHIKNHLFWQCEDNYARWPEDRLGEALRLFLRRFYIHFGQARFPNYFIESCNDFKCIPKPLLLKQQRRLADILEAPVMHILSAIGKLKYLKKDFYPNFNTHRLYEILTSKNPLRIINPSLPIATPMYDGSSESDDDNSQTDMWDKSKAHDKHYQWKKERQRQVQERKKAFQYNKRQKASAKQAPEINTKIILPFKMEVERRRLVLEFFISHFIAMARSSEKFGAVRQAVIYLEQSKRLCMLLVEEPGGDITADEYLGVIGDKLGDCQRKLANQGGFKLPPRRDSPVDQPVHKGFSKTRPRYDQIICQDSPTDTPSAAFTFVDVHTPNFKHREEVDFGKSVSEESKL